MKISTYKKFVFVWLLISGLYFYIWLWNFLNFPDPSSSFFEQFIIFMASELVITFVFYIILGIGCLIFDFLNYKKNSLLILSPIVIVFSIFLILSAIDYYYHPKHKKLVSDEQIIKFINEEHHKAENFKIQHKISDPNFSKSNP